MLGHLQYFQKHVKFFGCTRLVGLLVLAICLLIVPVTGCTGDKVADENSVAVPPGQDATPSLKSSGERQGFVDGPESEIAFPRHYAPVATDRGGQYFAGKLVLDSGCLRLDAPPYDPSNPSKPPLLIWPSVFAISNQGDTAWIVDGFGRIVAHVGDHIRLTTAVVSYQQAQDNGLIQEFSAVCTGPYLMVGDEVTSFDRDNELLEFRLADPEVYFVRQKTIVSSLQELLGAQVVGELILDGHCLRIMGVDGHMTSIKWPPGFTPNVHQGVVQIRNGGGQVIAQVGDRISGGGAYSDSAYGDCPGGTFAINSIEILPDVEVYFPRQDGTLETNREMERFIGRLVLTRRCLKVDDAVRESDQLLIQGGRPLLIWPETFTFSLEEGVASIVDKAGRVVALVGDEVQFSAVAVSYREALEHKGFREISPACSGPYWVVGDDFVSESNSESP